MSQSGYTQIVTYNTSTADLVPSAGNLAQGELAVNVTDKKIYTKDSGGAVVQVGSGPSATETLTNKTLNSPTLVTPVLGTPSSGNLTNCTFPTLNQDTTGTAAKANALNSATTTVNVSSSAAPTAGQVLTALNATTAAWQTPGTGPGYVSSVGLSMPSGFTVSNSPITTSGTLAVSTTLSGVLKGNGTGFTTATEGTDYVAPGGALGTPSSGVLTNCTFPTLNQNTTGTASNVTGVVTVAHGGTGATTLTGVLKGNGTSAFTAATAGTDYVAPGVATTFTAKQALSGSTSTLAAVLTNAAELCTISATAATGTINYDVTTQSVLYYTTNASGNWTMNVRGNGTTSLDSLLSTGQSITVVFLATTGTTAYYQTALTIDGASVTPKWPNGTAPSSGNASSIESYVYVIMKTGSATFTVLASRTQFA